MVQLFSRKQLTCTHYAWQKSWPISQECLFQTEIIFLKKEKKKTERGGGEGETEGTVSEKDRRRKKGREEDFLICQERILDFKGGFLHYDQISTNPVIKFC